MRPRVQEHDGPSELEEWQGTYLFLQPSETGRRARSIERWSETRAVGLGHHPGIGRLTVLARGFIAVKRHLDHGNSYKENI